MREALPNVSLLILLLGISFGSSVAGDDLGTIKNFRQLESTEDTITLAWDFEAGTTALTFYSIMNVEEGFESNIKCPLASCTHVVDFLNACSEYHFELTPHYQHAVGDKASTSGHTADILPGMPMNVKVEGTGDKDTMLSWDIPTENPSCIEQYEVCRRLEGETDQECFKTNDTTANLDMLQLCSHYYITVKGVTSIGGLGDEAQTELKTADGVPGEPQDLQVKEWGADSVTVTFHDPLTNPLCVNIYAFTWHEYPHIFRSSSVPISEGQKCNPICENTIAPLPPCKNVTILVAATNHAGVKGTPASVETSTADLDPLPPSSIHAEPISPTDIQVSWKGTTGNTCAYEATLCWVDDIVFDEVCQDVEVDEDGSGNYKITDVLPCTKYEISVVFKSPAGKESDVRRTVQATTDIEPSPVLDLKITAVGTTDVTFSYRMPDTNPQCAVDIKDKYIDVTDDSSLLESKLSGSKIETGSTSTIHKDGLLSCSDYYIEVTTMSPSGLESTPANISFTTTSAVSTEPQHFGTHKVEETLVVLQWLKPRENSRCVTEYKLTVSDGITSKDYPIRATKASPTKLIYPVEDLTSCTGYTASLLARSSEKDSDPVTTTFKTLCS